MDIRLKGKMDGVEAGECIRTRLHVPVIYTTANSDNETLLRAGVDSLGIVTKPYDDVEIRTAIEHALALREVELRLLRTSLAV